MSILAFIQKWNPSIHGHSIYETKFVDYMKTKWLIIDYIDTEYISKTTVDECLDWLNLYRLDIMRTNADTTINLAIIKRKFLIFRKRHFAVPNQGLISFQKKWRDYYKKRIKFVRKIKNIQYRQIHGKYPKFN